MDPLRFGLLGTGYWALNTHGAALASSPHARLEGVWGRDVDKAHDVATQLGTVAYQELSQLLDRVDAVAISLPPDVQATLAVRAAQAGCHLLLDKPLALDVELAQSVVDAAQDAGVASVVFFTARFRPELERWIEAAIEAGPWHSAHLVQYANIYQPGNPYAASSWRRERGALWDIGPHALSVLVPVMGRVTSVAARRGPAGSDTVHLVFTHGATSAGAGTVAASTVSLSLTMPPSATTSQLVLYGATGTWPRPEVTWQPVEALRGAIAELAALVDSGERAHRCDARFGLEVVRVLASAEAALDLPAVELPE